MKKVLAVMIVAIMAIALCVSASANYSLDRVQINNKTLGDGTDPLNLARANVAIKPGDKLYIIGWAYGTAKLDKIVYTVNGGQAVECTGEYRDRSDLVAAFGAGVPAGGEHAGFGLDEDGMMELTGIDQLAEGTYKIAIKAIYADGSEEAFNNEAAPGEFTLTISENVQTGNPTTADASVIAIAAVACVALAGVVIAKKVK